MDRDVRGSWVMAAFAGVRRAMAGLLLAAVASFAQSAAAQSLPPVITTFAGGGSPASGNGDGGPATSARLSEPVGVAVDAGGNVYVSERYSFTVRKISTSGVITTVAGNGTQAFNGDGIAATSAGMDVRGIAVGPAGDLYIADGSNKRIRKVSADGIVSTIARTGLAFPSRVAVSPTGVVHVIDGIKVYKVVGTGTLQLVAGNGQYGSAGDGGPAIQAELYNPSGLAFDGAGNLYIIGGERVRRVDANGMITTVAGGGPFKIDPIATHYRWLYPYAAALDSRGNLYVASGNNTVRSVSPAGIADNVAGRLLLEFGEAAGAMDGFSGDGGPAVEAMLFEPEGVAVDAFDNVYIADTRNNRIRKVTPVPTPRMPFGVGAFSPYRTYPVGSFGFGAVVADVTGDGRDDALMLTHNWAPEYPEPDNDNRLNLFIQNQDGTLAPPQKYAHDGIGLLESTTAIATGDLNGDGKADVVVGMHDGFQVYLGSSEGLVKGMAIPGLPHAQVVSHLVIIDINGDDRLDVVSLSGGRAEGGSYPDDLYGFIHFHGDGAGGFTSKVFVPMDDDRNWGSLQAQDLNGDGARDLVGTWSGTYQTPDGMWHYHAGIAWKPRETGGRFGSTRYATIEDAYGFSQTAAIGDFTGDGRKDVVLAKGGNAPQAAYALLAQDANGDFSEVRRWQAFDVPLLLAAADVDRDGRDDLLAVHSGWHAIGLQAGTADGLDVEVKYYIDESSNQVLPGLALGDLNGDGCVDVAMGDRNYGLVVLSGWACLPASATTPATATATLQRSAMPLAARVDREAAGQADAASFFTRRPMRQVAMAFLLLLSATAGLAFAARWRR